MKRKKKKVAARTKAKAKKGKAKKARIKPEAKSKARVKSKPRRSKAKGRVDLIMVEQGKNDVFDEVEELRRVETCLDVIFGHLRRVKNAGGEGSLQLILDYIYSKYGVRFFARS